jgi:biotin carboxyl carrier protein
MKVNKDILSIYEEILTNNKKIISELELVKLNNTNYSNLKYDTDGTQYDSVNKSLLDDLNVAAKSAGVIATITTASTGHPSGTNSRHPQKAAVDISIINGINSGNATNSANGNSEFRSLGNKLKDSLVSMGYSWNVESGNEKSVLWQTNTGGNHYNHLHISNIGGASSSGDTTTTTKKSSVFDADKIPEDTFLTQTTGALISKNLPLKESQLTEQKSFGKDVTNRYGKIIIPKDSNPKIKSPISGVVYNKKYFSGCVNQITIKNEDKKKIYLQFCGVSSPLVRDGQTISKGDVIGKTDSDVDVTMFDSSWNMIPIGLGGIKSDSPKDSKDSDNSDKKNRSKSSSSVFDADKIPKDDLTTFAASLPSMAIDKVFGNRYDKSGNMTQKRWGGVSDKRPVDPWVLNFIKDPFGRKKVTENIERIKKLL